MATIETIERNGYTATIDTDEYAERPDFDGQGAILSLAFVARHHVQVEHADYNETGAAQDLADAVESAYDRWGSDWDRIERYMRSFWNVVSFDRTHWDRGADLIALVTADMLATWGSPPEYAERAATDALAPWEGYRDGDVYGYSVESPSGAVLDSCSGYYGDRELPYIRECIDRAIDDDRADVHAKRADMYRRLVNAS